MFTNTKLNETTTDENKERMEREKVITILRLVKENGLKLDIAADEICSLFNVVGQSEQLVCSVCGQEPNPYFYEEGDTVCVDCFNDMTAN